MVRKKVRPSMEIVQTPFELPPVVEGSLARAVGSGDAEAALSTASTDEFAPLTKAQVHYWRELCGVLTQVGPAGLPSAEDFPPALCPSRATLHAMVERGIL